MNYYLPYDLAFSLVVTLPENVLAKSVSNLGQFHLYVRDKYQNKIILMRSIDPD